MFKASEDKLRRGGDTDAAAGKTVGNTRSATKCAASPDSF